MLTVLAILLLLPLGLESQKPLSVAGVEFTGNRSVKTEDLRRVFGIGRGEDVAESSLSEALERILSHYRDRGYVLASATVEKVVRGDSLLLAVRIREGDRFSLGAIEVEGSQSISTDQVLSRMDTKPGTFFNAQIFGQDMERVLRLFEDQGFAFVQVVPESFGYDTLDKKISLTIRVVEGDRVRLAGARFPGVKSTDPGYLAREAGIRTGAPFTASKLENGTRRLARLTFLSSVGQLRPVSAGERGLVWAEAEVTEGNANTIYGVLGLEPGEEGGLTGLVNLNLENLTGRGRGVRAEWRRVNRLTSWLHLAYREPFILSYDVALSGSFRHHIRDTSYTQSGLKIDFQTRSIGVLGLTWGLSAEQVLPGSYPVPKSRSIGLTAGLYIDTRRNPRSEERGIFYDIRSEYALRRNSPTELVSDPEPAANAGELLFDFHHYIPSLLGELLYAGVHGRESYTSEEAVPVYDYFFLGGASTVRGYREEQFSGSRVGWVNLEQRFRLARDAYFYPFLDIGYSQGQSSEAAFGYGLGLVFKTRLGSMGLDYGLGEGDGPLDGKIHVRLRGEF